MKSILIVVAQLLVVAAYSVGLGLLTGWIWMKIMERRVMNARKFIQGQYVQDYKPAA